MMNKRQQLAEDRYLEQLLGRKCQPGYYSHGADPASISTLGRKVWTQVIPESSKKAEAR